MDPSTHSPRHWAGFLLLVALAGLLYAVGLPVVALPGMSVTTLQAGILILFTVGVWAFGVFPEPIGTLVFFLFAVLFKIGSPATVFSGFESSAWWLVFGGSITAVAVRTTGLGDRLSRALFARLSQRYASYVSAVATMSVGLAFVMPSTTGRVLLLTPIVLAMAERLGFKAGSNGQSGLVMTAAAATYMPAATILPANIPNAVLMGGADTLYQIKLQYGPYLLLHFPVLGAVKTLVLIWLVCRLFPVKEALQIAAESDRGHGLTPAEKMLAWILGGSLLLFATDFLHHVSPAWVTLAAGIACLLPVTGVVSVKALNERLQVTPLIYVAGFLGLGALMVESGVGEWLASHLLALSGPSTHGTAGKVVFLCAAYAVIGLVTTLPALPAILTPLASHFSAAIGLPLYTTLMLQVPVYSTVWLPYQSPPMMIAMHLGGVGLWAGTRLCLALALVTTCVLLPLDYAWWTLLGLFG